MGRRPFVLLAIGIILQLGTWPEVLMISWVVYYLPFFAGGMILWIYRPLWSSIRPVMFWASTIIFGILTLLWFEVSLPKWLFGVCSVPITLGFAQRMTPSVQSFFAWLGINSLAIYLFNGLAMGIVKGVLFKLTSWDGRHFLFFFPLLMAVGIALPLSLKYFALKWSPQTARYL